MKSLSIILFDTHPVKVGVRPPQSPISATAGAPWPKYHNIYLPWIRLLMIFPDLSHESKLFQKHIFCHLESSNTLNYFFQAYHNDPLRELCSITFQGAQYPLNCPCLEVTPQKQSPKNSSSLYLWYSYHISVSRYYRWVLNAYFILDIYIIVF